VNNVTSTLRDVYLPREDFSQIQLPVVELQDSLWVRIHLDVHQPIFFSRNANYRFSPAEGKYEVLYAASDFQTAFLEVFGDLILGKRDATGPRLSSLRWFKSVCSVVFYKSMQLCDFTRSEARTAMQTDLASMMHPDLSISQQWANAMMEHPDKVDGILYPSRFTGKNCLALFGGKENLSVVESVPFQDHDEALALLDELGIALV
jgi:hypothetical protein